MNDRLHEIINKLNKTRLTDIPFTPDYECPECKDTEVIIYQKDGYEFAKPCKCAEVKAAKRRMLRSGIDEEDLKKGFKDFNTFGEKGLIMAQDTAVKYYKDFPKIQGSRANSILLSGASGRGKTTLGLALANNLMTKRKMSVLYMPYREEVTALKQYILDDEKYSEKMERFKSTGILFIDDLLKGKVTESDLNIVYEIINHRYLARLPMIISTEKTPEELIEFDEAVGSRILEMCKGYIVVFGKDIPNYRLR